MERLYLSFIVIYFAAILTGCNSRVLSGLFLNSSSTPIPSEKTLAKDPIIYMGLRGTQDSEIQLQWIHGGGGEPLGYVIAYSLGEQLPATCEDGVQVPSSAITGTSYQINSLIPRETYAIRICAVNYDSTLTAGSTILVETKKVYYRSVGFNSTQPLSFGDLHSSTLKIEGSIATFSKEVPDNVGVGDALQYDSDSDTIIDAIAFIYRRISASQFLVRRASYSEPVPVISDTNWSLYRPYLSGADAETGAGNENTSLDTGVQAFEIHAGSRDLVTNNESWNFALYADNVHAAPIHISGWTTGPSNQIHYYTPVENYEVGESQRHKGFWGTGFRMSSLFGIHDKYVKVEGLAIQAGGSSGAMDIDTISAPAKIEVSESIFISTGSGNNDTFRIDTITGAVEVLLSNSLVINDKRPGGIGVREFDADALFYVHNVTAYAYALVAFDGSGANNHCYNCLAVQGGSAQGFTQFATVNNSASTDATADDFGGSGNRVNQTFSFVDASNYDYRLLPTDSGAKGFGADLSANGNLPVTTDILGQKRLVPYDIGAFIALPSENKFYGEKLDIFNIGPRGFDAKYQFSGDINGNGAVDLYFCNETKSPGCNPLSGLVGSMSRQSGDYFLRYESFPAGYVSDGDTLVWVVQVADPDGTNIENSNATDQMGYLIYRSVGPSNSSALATGAGNNLIISGSGEMTLSSPVPDKVGVGDAVIYDSDNDGTIDALAFIHYRTSSTVFSVRDKNGLLPIATTANDQDWSIFRAAASLYDAEALIENPNLQINFPNFDGNPDSKDLKSEKKVWNITLYDEGVEDPSTSLDIYGWKTGPHTYLKIYTPTLPSQVGTSQRHTGVLSTGWRDSDSTINIKTNFVRLEGLSLSRNAINARLIHIQSNQYPFAGEAEIQISNSLFFNNNSSSASVLQLDSPSAQATYKVWNNIIGNKSITYGGIFAADCTSTYVIYNNTIIHEEGSGVYMSCGAIYAANNLVQTNGAGVGFFQNVAEFPPLSFEYNGSSDGSADDWGGVGNQPNSTFTFENVGLQNYHLNVADTGAQSLGLDLSVDLSVPFSDDIDSQTRSGSWDIGADQF